MKQLRFALPLFLCAVHAQPSTALAETYWLQIKMSQLRSAPEFFAPAVESIRYGEAVEKLADEDGWMHVRMRGKSGFLPTSSLSEKQVVFSGRDAGRTTADASDVVLAGKGFSKEVEDTYKALDSSLRFDLVDSVERIAVADRKELSTFAKNGGLRK